MLKRKCLQCELPMEGRSDKKFCGDQCRASFNNAQRSQSERLIMEVNKVLRKNRTLLKQLNPSGMSIIRKEFLSQNGFNFNYFTSRYKTRDGNEYLEHIVTKGTPDDKITPVVQTYLDNVNIDNELIIVDPYFFAKPKNLNYVTVLDQIIDKYISTIDNLVIITNTNSVNSSVKTNIVTMLQSKKATLNIVHKQNDDYHDRYWISGARKKGIVMGTSLNSLGNKVALLDSLKSIDVDSIISELTKDGLI